MTCQESIDLLMQYLDGELSPEQRRAVQQHLGDCPECVVYLETYRVVIQISRLACQAQDADPCVAVPDPVVQAIVAACRKKD